MFKLCGAEALENPPSCCGANQQISSEPFSAFALDFTSRVNNYANEAKQKEEKWGFSKVLVLTASRCFQTHVAWAQRGCFEQKPRDFLLYVCVCVRARVWIYKQHLFFEWPSVDEESCSSQRTLQQWAWLGCFRSVWFRLVWAFLEFWCLLLLFAIWGRASWARSPCLMLRSFLLIKVGTLKDSCSSVSNKSFYFSLPYFSALNIQTLKKKKRF